MPAFPRAPLQYAACLAVCHAFLGQAHADASNAVRYAWQPVRIGGGLFAKHIAVHPAEPALKYTYGMVGPARRWSPEGGEWVQIMTADSMPPGSFSYGGLESLALDPQDPDVVLIAVRMGRREVSVFRSGDRGASFRRSDLSVMPQGGHDVTRGERLAIDPLNSSNVYYGSSQQGLWRSADGGLRWQPVASDAISASADVAMVAFGSSSGTTNDRTTTLYVGVCAGGVLHSADGGATWQQVAGANGPAIDLTPQHMLRDALNRLWVTYARDSIWCRDPAGAWHDVTPNGRLSYTGVAVDPFNPQTVWAFAGAVGHLYRSTDAGASWTQLTHTCVAPDNRWAAQVTSESNWRSYGEITAHPAVRGRLYVAAGIGVWHIDNAYDQHLVFSNMSAGLEDQNTFDICSAPGGVLLTCVDDWTGFCHQDGPSVPPHQRLSHGKLYLGTSVDYCPAVTGSVVKVATNKQGPRMYDNDTGYSSDGGRTWTVFEGVRKGARLHEAARWGTIAVSAGDPDNIVWLPTSYMLPQYTLDRGETWQDAALPGVTNGGHIHMWVFKDALAADRVSPHTFYLYHWDALEKRGQDSGILFRTSDGGRSWTNVCNTLPAGLWHPKLVAAPGHAGELWFAVGRDGVQKNRSGLIRSRDGGATWSPVGEFDEPAAVALGKAAPRASYPAAYVVGTRAGAYGVWRSTDEGATWRQIAEYPCGIYAGVNCMDADKDVFGRVYIGFTGNSFVYGEPKK
jgi:photosystem II stability/assembly factor-like uncharacterized protein